MVWYCLACAKLLGELLRNTSPDPIGYPPCKGFSEDTI